MIVPMKKINLLCLEHERTAALEKLRELGIMHVDIAVKPESESVNVLEQSLQDTAKLYNILTGFKTKNQDIPAGLTGKEILKKGLELLEKQNDLEKERELLIRDLDTLSKWGDFQPKLLDTLAKNGIYVSFHLAFKDVYDHMELPEGITRILISRIKTERYFLLITQDKSLELPCAPLVLPEKSLSAVRAELISVEKEIADCKESMQNLAPAAGRLKEYFEQLGSEYEFVANRDTMVSDGRIAYLTGYVPAPEMEKLVAAAHQNGWALTAEDPELTDARVPTCIKKPAWMKIIDPLFDFIGIAPGYRENDVSLFFLIAFPIFFGMLIGDTAYGALFIVTALICKYVFRKKSAAQLPLNLLILLSIFSIIWGLLTGSCLGLPRNVLPGFLQGLDFLADPKESEAARSLAEKLKISNPDDLKDKFIQWFCFLLAALHLSSARLYKCFTEIRNWRSWGNLGWACLIWGNFFTAVNLVVFPGTFPGYIGYALYGVGLLFIVATTTAEAALNLPFSVVGSFVDVLSYIRLFAVGLSGVYVGTCFNDMGKMVLDALPKDLMAIGIIGLLLVALAGHILNIILGFMGVLVHAIRLNTLEFSNHIEMQWTGINYRPFKKKEKKD